MTHSQQSLQIFYYLFVMALRALGTCIYQNLSLLYQMNIILIIYCGLKTRSELIYQQQIKPGKYERIDITFLMLRITSCFFILVHYVSLSSI